MSAVPMLDSGRGTASPDELESLDGCPLCEAPRDRFTVLTTRGDRFAGERAVLCGRCGLVFLDPRLTPQALDRYYRSDTFSQEVRGGERPSREAIAYRDMRARRRWRFLQAALPRHGRCIEIGCGAGNFLEILSDAGYDVVGVDPSTGYAAYARERGLEVTAGRFPDDLSGGGPFDLAFMFHVLEHVPAPLEILRQIREQLDPGGLLLLEYPDVELAARRRFLPSTYFERAHLFDFSARTLTAFLTRAGFKVRRRFLEERRPPYDRNVLVVCEPTMPRSCESWDPAAAERLERALRLRLLLSRPLMPLRPLWKRAKKLFHG